jgi:hypothetical protein
MGGGGGGDVGEILKFEPLIIDKWCQILNSKKGVKP